MPIHNNSTLEKTKHKMSFNIMIGKSLRNREFRKHITTCMEQHMEQLPHNGHEKVLQGSTLPVTECKAKISFIRVIFSSRKPYKCRLYFLYQKSFYGLEFSRNTNAKKFIKIKSPSMVESCPKIPSTAE